MSFSSPPALFWSHNREAARAGVKSKRNTYPSSPPHFPLPIQFQALPYITREAFLLGLSIAGKCYRCELCGPEEKVFSTRPSTLSPEPQGYAGCLSRTFSRAQPLTGEVRTSWRDHEGYPAAPAY